MFLPLNIFHGPTGIYSFSGKKKGQNLQKSDERKKKETGNVESGMQGREHSINHTPQMRYEGITSMLKLESNNN